MVPKKVNKREEDRRQEQVPHIFVVIMKYYPKSSGGLMNKHKAETFHLGCKGKEGGGVAALIALGFGRNVAYTSDSRSCIS